MTTSPRLILFILLLFAASSTQSFTLSFLHSPIPKIRYTSNNNVRQYQHQPFLQQRKYTPPSSLLAESKAKSSSSSEEEDDALIQHKNNNKNNRRNILHQIGITSASLLVSNFATPHEAAHAASSSSSVAVGTPEHPVVVIGAGGRTGMAVSEALAGSLGGYSDVVMMTRSGKDPFQVIKLPSEVKQHLTIYPDKIDVRDLSSLKDAFQTLQPSAVVYCASASKQGGSAFEVDDVGVENVALACCTNSGGSSSMVLISALAVDKPESKSFKITNTLGGYLNGIMDAKRSGEQKLRSVFHNSNNNKNNNGYVILRPGVLINGKSKNGADDMELNQGDTIGGGLSRDELAGLVVGALQQQQQTSGSKGGDGGGITVEVYRKSTRQKLQPEFDIRSGNEHFGVTYESLFDGLTRDV